MNAEELHLRHRVHHAFNALAPAAPLPARVLERVHVRVEARAQRRRWTAAAVGVAAALVVLSLASLQLVPRSAVLHEGTPPQAGQSFGGYGGISGSGGPNAGMATPEAQAALPRNRPAPLMPCAPRDLQVSVSTDQSAYQQGAVVWVSTSATNRGLVACLYPFDPAVWVTDSRGVQWRLCPELATPPPAPAPTSTAYGNTAPMPAFDGGMNPSLVVTAGGLAPGQSVETSCIWHTAYGNVAPGTYTAHATWDGTSGTATLTITAASPTPTPWPPHTPTATPSPTPPLLPLPIP